MTRSKARRAGRRATLKARRITRDFRAPIVFDGSVSPLKTILFVVICLAWLLPGLIGHDPWKPDEPVQFGIVLSMLQGAPNAWLVPTLAGAPYVEYPPFYFWVAAFFAKLTQSFLPLHDGARLASAFFVSITMGFLAAIAVRLQNERAARICVLLLIASLGFLLRAHELSPALAAMSGVAIALYGMTWIASDAKRAGIIAGLGGALAVLCTGAMMGVMVLAVFAILAIVLREWRNPRCRRGFGLALAIIVVSVLFWPLLLIIFVPQDALNTGVFTGAMSGLFYLLNAQSQATAALNRNVDFLYLPKTIIWYALPAWPIAMWAWLKARRNIRDRIEHALPFVAFMVMVVFVILAMEPRDTSPLVLLLPLCLAAAQGMDKLSRTLASFVNWFGLFVFGSITLFLWAMYAGAVTGIPRNAARRVAYEVPGLQIEVQWFAVSVALILTVLWLAVVLRTRYSNRRAVVNWAAGVTVLWMLFNLLWLPAVDYAKSYRGMAKSLTAAIASNGVDAACISNQDVGVAQIASLDYFSGIRLKPLNTGSCSHILVQGRTKNPPASVLAAPDKIRWQGARPGDTEERFWLMGR